MEKDLSLEVKVAEEALDKEEVEEMVLEVVVHVNDEMEEVDEVGEGGEGEILNFEGRGIIVGGVGDSGGGGACEMTSLS